MEKKKKKGRFQGEKKPVEQNNLFLQSSERERERESDSSSDQL